MNETVQINLSRDDAAALRDMASIVRSGGLRNKETLADFQASGNMSYSRFKSKPRRFMHPEAACKIGPRGRRYLGGKVASEFGRLPQQFAQPTLTEVHVDAVLTQMSIAYRNPEYIGDMVFPRVQVVKESDKYFIFDKGPWLRDDANIRAPSAKFARGGYTLSDGTYSVNEWGFETPVDDRIRANSDSPLSPDRNASDFSADKIDLKMELLIKELLFTAANWTNTANVTNWNSDGGDPFVNFSTARLAVNRESGRRPNTIVMGVEVAEILMLHADLIDRIKYTGTQDRPAMVTPAMMAALFQVDQVLIGSGVYDTSNEPAAETEAFIWGKNCWIGYVAPAPAIETPSAGYVFTTGRKSDRYREEDITSDVIRSREAFDQKVTSADCGYLMTDCVD